MLTSFNVYIVQEASYEGLKEHMRVINVSACALFEPCSFSHCIAFSMNTFLLMVVPYLLKNVRAPASTQRTRWTKVVPANGEGQKNKEKKQTGLIAESDLPCGIVQRKRHAG